MELLIVIGLAIFALWLWKKPPKISSSASLTNVSRDKEKRYVRLEGDGDYELAIVGASKFQNELSAIAGGKTEDGHEFECKATLEREPGNPHDSNAVAVYIKERKVGYLSRDHARRLSAILDSKNLDGGIAKALIVGGWDRGRGDEGSFGVRLDIPIYE